MLTGEAPRGWSGVEHHLARSGKIADMNALGDLLGDSPGMRSVRERIARLLARPGEGRRLPPILVHGETGTGKGLVARMIHRAGPRPDGPFVDVNCAAIPDTLLEAEMFGYERGAFTDARRSKPGLLASGPPRHDLPRRGRAPPRGAAGEAPQGARGPHRAPPRRHARRAGRRLDRDRDERGPHGGRPAAPIPRGPLPPPRGAHGRAAAACASAPATSSSWPSTSWSGPAPTTAFRARRSRPTRAPRWSAHRWPGNVRELSNVLERAVLMSAAGEITAEGLGLQPAVAVPPRRRRVERPRRRCRSTTPCASTCWKCSRRPAGTSRAPRRCSGSRATRCARAWRNTACARQARRRRRLAPGRPRARRRCAARRPPPPRRPPRLRPLRHRRPRR